MSTAVRPTPVVGDRPSALRPDLFIEPLLGADVGSARENLRGHLFRGSVRLACLLLIDLAAIGLARFLLRFIRSGGMGAGLGGFTSDLFPPTAVSGPQLAFAVIVGIFFVGGYRAGDPWRDPVRILTASGVGLALVLYADLWHGQWAAVLGRGALMWALLGPLLVAARSAAGVLSKSVVGAGMKHRVLEVRGTTRGPTHSDLGPSYKQVASLPASELPSDVERMERWLEGRVDTILVQGELPPGQFDALTDFALTHGCRLLCAPKGAGLLGVDTKRVWFNGHPYFELTTPGLRASHLVLKRSLDIVFALLALVVLSPLLLLLAALISIDSPGPVLFRQRRPGLQGRWFAMLKFRSMRTNAEELLREDPDLYQVFVSNGCKVPEEHDPRITRVGRFIRKTSLDELPQLLNVLRGEMSLVGPRPLVGPELSHYGGRIPTLLSVKPGMTGLWQVSGRSAVPFPHRAEMDLEYVRRWSFLLDLWILVLTPAAVLIRKGAY